MNPRLEVSCKVTGQVRERVFSPQTRVLVTHGITYLPHTDLIVVLREGRVSETGAYRQLMDNKGAFSDFLLQYLTEADDGDEDADGGSDIGAAGSG